MRYRTSCKSGFAPKPKITNKYQACKVTVNGIVFDSKKEARRYEELLQLEEAGKITNLQRQVKYVLIPTQREPDKIGKRGGVKPGKVIEKECAYYADFQYLRTEDSALVVEDTKGLKTTEYIIKRKLMLLKYGIKINEV